jgi:hypothetical protein
MNMSTPIANLPSQDGARPIDDPMVQDVLKEMDAEVAAQRGTQQPSPPQIPMQAYQPQMQAFPSGPMGPMGNMMMHPPMQSMPITGRTWWNIEWAKQAAFAAVIAIALFQPAVAALLVSRIPKLGVSDMYVTAMRGLLLFAILYGLMWKTA